MNGPWGESLSPLHFLFVANSCHKEVLSGGPSTEGKELGRSPGRLGPGHTGGMRSHQESGLAQRFGIPQKKILCLLHCSLKTWLARAAGNILSLYFHTTFQSGCLPYLHLSLGFVQTFPTLPLTKGGHDFFTRVASFCALSEEQCPQ